MARVDVDYIDLDRGWEEFTDKMANLAKGPSVTIGVHKEDAPRADDSDLNNAELLALHEFGAVIQHPGGTPYIFDATGNIKFVPKGFPNPDGYTQPHAIPIPARPVLRGALWDARRTVRTSVGIVAGNYLSRGINAVSGLERAMDKIGKLLRSIVRARFGSGELEPNAPSTIKRKGFDMPLIESGRLLKSIDYETHLDLADFLDVVSTEMSRTGSLGGGVDASQF